MSSQLEASACPFCAGERGVECGDSGWLLLAEGAGRAAGQLEKCQ